MAELNIDEKARALQLQWGGQVLSVGLTSSVLPSTANLSTVLAAEVSHPSYSRQSITIANSPAVTVSGNSVYLDNYGVTFAVAAGGTDIVAGSLFALNASGQLRFVTGANVDSPGSTRTMPAGSSTVYKITPRKT